MEVHEIVIENNSTGNSYARVFGPFLDEFVKRIVLEEPYVQSGNHVSSYEQIVLNRSKQWNLKLNK
jgi:hypothetical protein